MGEIPSKRCGDTETKLARLRASLRRNPSPKPARNPAAGAQPRQPPGLLVREAAARKRLQGDGLLPLPDAGPLLHG